MKELIQIHLKESWNPTIKVVSELSEEVVKNLESYPSNFISSKEVLTKNGNFAQKYFLSSQIQLWGYLSHCEDQDEFFEVINETEYGNDFRLLQEASADPESAILGLMEKVIESFSRRLLGQNSEFALQLEFGEKNIHHKKIDHFLFHYDSDEWFHRTKDAINFLKHYAPISYSNLAAFTKEIIPIKEEGIVSYSSQEIPGHSIINYGDRKFENLIDDLIHENGHHFLNNILNQKDLINEDDDDIFYSPWRRAFRPIRGIYHGYMTFCFGLFLFDELTENSNIEYREFFSLRFAEEFLMLKFCIPQISEGFRQKKITKDGIRIANFATDYILSLQPKFESLKNYLNIKNQKEITNLEDHLKTVSDKYEI